MACCGMVDDKGDKKRGPGELFKEEILMTLAFIISTVALFLPHRLRIALAMCIRWMAEVVPHRSIHSLRFDE